ncbi:VTT domain-containing protein, partial [Candidatus Saccharibacteria bacterium]|nr:VTT domain-containing protein [Candidatus Saccharibacteria bacterium]
MIPGIDLIDFIKYVGVLGVVLVIFAESGLLIGFFLPGDSLLFTAGFLTQAGFLPINIHLLVLFVFVAAVLGDSVGYAFGKKVGSRVFTRKNSLLFRQENILKAQSFYEKHGAITIVIARFIPIVRTFAPVVAGVANMKYKTFLSFNLIGAFLWAAGVTYLGYFVGKWFKQAGIDIDTVLIPIVLLIIFFSVLPPAIHILKDKKQRDALWDG